MSIKPTLYETLELLPAGSVQRGALAHRTQSTQAHPAMMTTIKDSQPMLLADLKTAVGGEGRTPAIAPNRSPEAIATDLAHHLSETVHQRDAIANLVGCAIISGLEIYGLQFMATLPLAGAILGSLQGAVIRSSQLR